MVTEDTPSGSEVDTFTLNTNEGESYWVADTIVTLKAAPETTDGSFALAEELRPPESGPPLHVHKAEDELFYVVEGMIKFCLDGEITTVGDRSSVYIPKGTPHTFFVVGDEPARILTTYQPLGFQNYFKAVGDPADEKELPPELIEEHLPKLEKEAEGHNLEYVGPPLPELED